MNTGQISDPSLRILPSKDLHNYITTVKVSGDMPTGVASIVFKNKSTKAQVQKPPNAKYLLTTDDRNYLMTLNLKSETNILMEPPSAEAVNVGENDKLLSVQDLHWLFNYVQGENDKSKSKVYLHELLQGSQLLLPKNAEIPRNAELEKRCQKLKASQQNVEYNQMTKDVNVVRKKHPEDSIAYQMKQMNRHLIAIFQFILSVMAGFAFGFIGVELIIGNLDFGFRLLLGIIFSLIIALAELYFLAKRLNEDWHFETVAEGKKKIAKLD